MTRRILLVANRARAEVRRHVCTILDQLTGAGVQVAMLPGQAYCEHPWGAHGVVAADPRSPVAGAELVGILGGDGTILHAANLSRGSGVPLLGINFGHVGFLAQAERDDTQQTVQQILDRDYTVEERMALDVVAYDGGHPIATNWALNEVTVEKASRERMLEIILEIDDRPLTSWGCDGVIVATPTGSTAYGLSAGGPVVWPNVEAMMLVPISAHDLFARPLVVGPDSTVAVELVDEHLGRGVMWCDGARLTELPQSARVEVSRSATSVLLARLDSAPFTDRLVEKFGLSVEGWRGRARERARQKPAGAVGTPE